MSSKVLVVDDKQIMRDSVGMALQRGGFEVVAASDGVAALKAVGKHRPAAVITDLMMPEMDGLELLKRLRDADEQLPVIVMSAYGTVDKAVEAMRGGAYDFVQKPFENDQLVMTIQRAVEKRRLVQENAALKSNFNARGMGHVLIGQSPPMRKLAQQIQQIAHSQGTVLVVGESGTGKEVIARTIHQHSPRRDQVMLCLNCAALSAGLLESELFGHEKGAFTGADNLRKGRFELADNGTLLLDEISEIDPGLQAKLLRVLQERAFERVGSSMTMSVDVRVIATTNRDLTHSVRKGDFRQDLYYRLNVLPIHVPPLRARLDDIPLLVDHFLLQVATREGREPKRMEPGAIEVMMKYNWPGNVRELQNICERASVLTRGQNIAPATIQPWLLAPSPFDFEEEPVAVGASSAMDFDSAGGGMDGGAGIGAVGGGWGGLRVDSGNAMGSNVGSSGAGRVGGGIKPLEVIEREQVVRTLGTFNGNRQQTADALGIGLRTLGLKLKKWKEKELVPQAL